jgi:hypothetical protein
MPRNNNQPAARAAAPVAAGDCFSLVKRILFHTLVVSFVLVVVFYIIGRAGILGPAFVPPTDEDYEANGGVDADSEYGLFAVPSTCSKELYLTRARWLVGNFSTIVRRQTTRFEEETASGSESSLNRFLERMVRTHEIKNKKAQLRAAAFSFGSEPEAIGDTKKKDTITVSGTFDTEKGRDVDEQDEQQKNSNPHRHFFDKEAMEKKQKELDEAEAALESEPRYADLTDDDAERVSHFAFMLIRWAKGAKSFVGSSEKHCDIEGLLDQPGEVSLVDDNMPLAPVQPAAAAEEGGDAANKPPVPARVPLVTSMTVREYITKEMMPSLYADAAQLLRFCYSVADAAQNDDKSDGRAAEMRDFVESAALHHADLVAAQIAPFRDVVIRTFMSLADVAFSAEQEGYQTSFLAQLVRMADGIVANHVNTLVQQPSSDSKKSNKKKKSSNIRLPADSASSSALLPVTLSPTCTSPLLAGASRFFCSTDIRSRLVSAKGGADYSVDVSQNEDDEGHYAAYQFGLLRATFLEELIALRGQTMPELRVAYAMSLLELQRYDTALKAVRNANGFLEMFIKKKRQEQQQSSASSSSSRRFSVDLERYEAAQQIMGQTAACLTDDHMLEYLSRLQQQHGNLKVPMRWRQLLSSAKCDSAGDGGGKKNSTLAELVKNDAVANSVVSFWWPVENAVEGQEDVLAELMC